MIRAVVTRYQDSLILALKDEKGFIGFKLYTEDSRKGRIVNGRVEKRVENINSCFVRLSKGEYGFLGMPLKPGSTHPVQIVKDGKGDKKPTVTMELSIAGRYVVIILKKGQKEKSVYFSQKLSEDRKAYLGEALAGLQIDEEYAILFRTNAGFVDFSETKAEILKLSGRMDTIVRYQDNRTDYSILYEPDCELIRDLNDIELNMLGEVITDSEEVFSDIKRDYYETLPAELQKKIKLTFYQDELLPLPNLLGMKAGLSAALDKKVWLKSGSYLVIEQTEALVSIDVNSGKNEGKGVKEEMVYRINEEAAKEIARQLRLRNLSGIIVIDFINMKKQENNERLIGVLKEAIRNDSTRTVFMDMTKLGLVELTRRREGKSLPEMIRDSKM